MRFYNGTLSITSHCEFHASKLFTFQFINKQDMTVIVSFIFIVYVLMLGLLSEVLTSVPMSFMRARASSLRLPCSTPELTKGMGMSLGRDQRTNQMEVLVFSYRIL